MADKTEPAGPPPPPAPPPPPPPPPPPGGGGTLVTTVSGTITIGTIAIPISTPIPPTTPGDFEFKYTAIPPGSGTKIPVGEFITWAAQQIDPGLTPASLPTSLQTLNIAVDKLNFDTKGNFDIKVEIGKESGGTWDNTWTPIPGLSSFTLSGVALEIVRTAGS